MDNVPFSGTDNGFSIEIYIGGPKVGGYKSNWQEVFLKMENSNNTSRLECSTFGAALRIKMDGSMIVSNAQIGHTESLINCLLYTSPSPRDATLSRMPSSA